MTHDVDAQQLVPSTFDDPFNDFMELPTIDDVSPADGPDSADEMEAVLDIPVKVKAVLGGARAEVGKLLRMRSGSILELDRRVGEPVDVFVNGRLIARGELVLIDGMLGVTLTEIVKQDG